VDEQRYLLLQLVYI